MDGCGDIMVSAEGHSIKTSYDQLTAVSENALSLKLGELSGRVETKRTKVLSVFSMIVSVYSS